MNDEALKELLDFWGKGLFTIVALLALAAGVFQGALAFLKGWFEIDRNRRADEVAERRLTRLKLRYEIELIKKEHGLTPVVGDDSALDRLTIEQPERPFWKAITTVDVTKLSEKRATAYRKAGWLRVSAYQFGGIYCLILAGFAVYVFRQAYPQIIAYVWHTGLAITFGNWVSLLLSIAMCVLGPGAIAWAGIALLRRFLYAQALQSGRPQSSEMILANSPGR